MTTRPRIAPTGAKPPRREPAPTQHGPFCIGDVVMLRSGGFAMTVAATHLSGTCAEPEEHWIVETTWASGPGGFHDIRSDQFDARMLKTHAAQDIPF